MLSVREILKNHKSGPCKVKAYFYSIGGETLKVFITDSKEDYGNEEIFLPISVSKAVIEQDETFGILVGGIYSYYAMEAIVDGYIVFNGNQAIFNKVNEITLSENELTQSFFF